MKRNRRQAKEKVQRKWKWNMARGKISLAGDCNSTVLSVPISGKLKDYTIFLLLFKLSVTA